MDWSGVEAPLATEPLTEGCGEAVGRAALALAPPAAMGALRLVDRLRMSLPWTTMLSLDFLRSRVSISAGLLARVDAPERVPTITASVQVDNGADADVDDAEEALVLLLELLLVEDLHRQHALFVDPPAAC